MTTATATRTVYEQLERLALPHLETFQADLTKHDRNWIEKNPRTPFIHMTRRSGTLIIGLYPADSEVWPADGERRPYIFAHCDRWHILKDSTGIVDCSPAEHTYHYFDGRRVYAVTHAEASRIRKDFVRTVSTAWGR